MSLSNSHALVIETTPRPEVMERVLRVIRHRGFDISAMNMEQMNDCQNLKIAVTVSGERAVELLNKQLAKLIDVVDIQSRVMEQNIQIRA